jgi:hypothetical protein
MTTYARRWSRACRVTAAVGVGLALVVWNPLLVLVLGMVGMVPAMVGFSLHAQTNGLGPGRLSRAEIKRMLVRAACVAAGIVAVGAYIAASPTLACTLVLAAVVTSPWVGRLAHPVGEAPEPTHSDVDDARSVDQLSIDELCQLWRRTFHAVLHNDPSLAVRIVGMRQVYLDEMERRDPAGLRSWLWSGPHAGSSPEKYLAAEGDPGIT